MGFSSCPRENAKNFISVTANVAAAKMYALCSALLSGNKVLAEKIN